MVFHRAFVAALVPMLVLAIAAPSGCKAYEAKPLDPTASAVAWSARTPADESVREFAARLRSADPTSPTPGPGPSPTPSQSPSPAPFDPSDGLTMDEAEPVALVFNRELRVARQQARVALAAAEFAGLWDDPVLGVELERILGGVPNPWIVAATVGITIPVSGRLDAAKSLAGAEYATRIQEIAAQEWETRVEVRALWLEWSAQVLRVELVNDLVARLRRVEELARRQYDAGVMSRIDSRVFAVKLAGSEADAIAIAARAAELEIELRDRLGLAPEAPVRLVPSMRYAMQESADADLRRAMMDRSLELASARSAYRVAEESLRLEIREQFPDITVGPGYKYEDAHSRILLGLSLPIPLWNRNQQGVAEATAEREVARARYESTFERLGSKLAVALVQYRNGVAVRESVEARVIPLADEQDAEVVRVAEIGRVDPLLILEAIQAQYEAKSRLIDARRSESIGAVRVDGVVGPPVPVAAASTPPSAPASSGGTNP